MVGIAPRLPLSLDNVFSVGSLTLAMSGLLLRSHSNASSKIGPLPVGATIVGVLVDCGNADSKWASGLFKYSTEGLFLRSHSIDSSITRVLSFGFDNPLGVGILARFASA